uniref:Putative disease resistance RPP13-like protein 1 n=1 Tax=Anthurium amnicola TaxID=1678845 RepID=A0A1D1ZBA7_9ARAE
MLGRILYNNLDEDHWKDILGTDLWELQEAKDNIIPALRLSYYHLSSPLRVCFAYCGVFPKGHYFIKDELVCLWMAQCYVKSTHSGSMEDVAQTYFDDLRQRSFFEYCGGGRFKMHDLIHHLALSLSPGECSKIEGGKLSNSLEKVRHLWLEGQAETERLLMPCESNDKLQYLWTLYMIKKGPGSFSGKFLDDVFLSTKHLRVLYLCDDEISELPDSFGSLKFLRYLGISGGQLRRLPETLGNLHYLQTLQVKRARSMEELPKSLKGLVNLRYLKLHRF